MNQPAELSRPTELQPSANELVPDTIINLPLSNRANALIAALTKSGFQVEDMMSSQVIAIALPGIWNGRIGKEDFDVSTPI